MRGRVIGLVPLAVLISVTAIWGSTFPVIKGQLDTIDPSSFLFIRFSLTTALMAVLFHRQLWRMNLWQWGAGVICGLLYGGAQLVQTWGLLYTSASISGFVSGLSVIIAPFMVWVFYRQPPKAIVTAAATVAFVGLGIITITGPSTGGTSWGALLCIIGAFGYGTHIVAIGHFSPDLNPWAFTTVQMAVAAAIAGIATIPTGLTLPAGPSSWAAMGYMVVFASMLAVGGQSWAQRHIDAGRAAIIMALEPVFAVLFAVALGMDSLTWNIIVGGGLIFAATIAVEGSNLFRVAKLRRVLALRGRDNPYS